MKKAQNRLSDLKTDFSLPRKKILRGKRNYQKLFQSSSVLRSASFDFRYRFYPGSINEFNVGFVAPKRKFRKAVERNRIKRVLREAFRVQQWILSETVHDHDKEGILHGIFIAKKNSSFADIKAEIGQTLKTLASAIQADVSEREFVHRSQSQLRVKAESKKK